MIRGLALTVSLLVAGAGPALAQTHTRPHGQGYPHGPGHVRPDSATHAAMHAALHGSWTGTLSSHRGDSSGLSLSVAHDSARKVLLTMRTDRPIHVGVGSDFMMHGDKLHWTQDLSGKSCKATAVLTTATPRAPEAIRGELACEDGEITFTLHKTTG
jgi:hypothetical protein